MNISERGIDLIKQFEGVRLHAYDDGVGVVTIGYGHTKGVRWGDRITQDEAENLLQQDLVAFERCVADAVDVPLTQSQFDALVSFAFNVGCGALRRSTLRSVLNAGDYEGAADQLLRWNRGGGRVLRGLVRRREAERALFLYGVGDAEDELVEAEKPDVPDAKTPNQHCQRVVLKETKVPVKDACVVTLQQALNRWARNLHVKSMAITVDGVFGPVTANRVGSFQQTNHLVVDRVVGPMTWKALGPHL